MISLNESELADIRGESMCALRRKIQKRSGQIGGATILPVFQQEFRQLFIYYTNKNLAGIM